MANRKDDAYGYEFAWFKQLATDCLKNLDIDGNGEVDYGEWEEFMKTLKKLHDKLDEKSFAKGSEKLKLGWKEMAYEGHARDHLQKSMKADHEKQIKMLATWFEKQYGKLSKTDLDKLKVKFEKAAMLAKDSHVQSREVLNKLCNSVFARIDTNKNGNLEKDEFFEFHKEFSANLGTALDQKVMEKLYSDMDKADGKEDGTVSQEQFVKFYVQHFCSKPLPIAKCKIDALTQVATEKYKADMEKLGAPEPAAPPGAAASPPAVSEKRKSGCSCVVS